jgi:hypothetical protein
MQAAIEFICARPPDVPSAECDGGRFESTAAHHISETTAKVRKDDVTCLADHSRLSRF